ncbi:hypothetical protein ARMGADRAFT_1035642 [Armillaria gallica]|uniref:Reverse transcriptase RNase H-like domain-containing protein n=1 Tax=Armillaria gallica TaxID=47427 RepID=A0A2H3DBM0_ARMGA|nr:hypothetical protein ARMGADRAFT_1035642 [Armillaria gallica]
MTYHLSVVLWEFCMPLQDLHLSSDGRLQNNVPLKFKETVEKHWNHSHVPLDYLPDHKPIWMVTDTCSGSDWQKGNIAAFYSTKLNLAQQNYAVHELEMLAGIKMMMAPSRHPPRYLSNQNIPTRGPAKQKRYLSNLETKEQKPSAVDIVITLLAEQALGDDSSEMEEDK